MTWLTEQLRIDPGSLVVDLAAGTGKLTRLLLNSGATVVALEPIDVMRDFITTTSPGALPVGGEAGALPFRSGSIDIVTIAQAFHWFDSPPTHSELSRVIRPGGGLGLVWNVRDRTIDWIDAIWSIMDRVEKNAPWRDHETWSGSERQLPGFSPFRSAHFVHTQPMTPELLIGRLASVSHVAVLAEKVRRGVLDEARRLLATHPDTRHQKVLPVTYRTDCFVAERIGVSPG